MMRKGFFVFLAFVFLSLQFLVVPRICRAETVGVIITRGSSFHEEIHDLLAKNVVKRKSDIRFIVQRPYPDPVSWSNAARKLIASDVSVILTYGAAATMAVLKEKPGMPVVYAALEGSVAQGIKARNVTGVQSPLPLQSVLRYLRDMTNVETLGVLYNSWEEDSVAQVAEIKAAGQKYGIRVIEYNLRKSADLPSLFPGAKMDALYITNCATVGFVYQTAMGLAANRNIPVASLIYDKQKQALITLAADLEEQAAMGADTLLSVVRVGTAQGIAPLESKKITLIYNYRSSQEMGLRTSLGLVTDATEVIY